MDINDDQQERQFFLKRLWLLLKSETPQAKDITQEINNIIDEVEEKGFIDEDQGDMIHNIIVLKDTAVREIMVPKVDMVALERSASIEELVEAITQNGCSRIPIYQKTMDNIVGIIYAKEVLKYWQASSKEIEIEDLLHPPYFVPESKKLTDLLQEFRQQQTKIAIIIDEFGGVDGLITIGDIIEEIVGDIQAEDESHPELDIVDRGDGSFEVEPKMPIDEFAEAFALDIPEGDYDTVAGFINFQLERIPKSGETLKYEGCTFEIAAADKKRISKLILHTPTEIPA